MPKINVLTKEVSELIAAGEVIERPSSVIKELLENSIDSGANVITVEIKNGGRTYMRITDNGCGMSAEDIPTAFLRHATSKIHSKDDLDKILTLGFRGEALASICAVSKAEVLSKVINQSYGTHYVIEGSEEKIIEKIGCPDGTTIVIRDIFYNVPARLKFLKKDVTEGNAVSGVVSKLALSHPEISFKLIRDNKTELVTAGDGKLFSAIYSVFGKSFADTLIPVDYSYNGINVKGYISKPLESKAKRTFQNFFINNRYVKSVTCMVSLEEAYKNQIMTGKFPACILCLDIPPGLVDVNVHPAKIEVKFSNEKMIYESVYFAVKNALLHDASPKELKIENKKHFSGKDLYQFSKPDKGVQTAIPFKEIEKSKPDFKFGTDKAQNSEIINSVEIKTFSKAFEVSQVEAPKAQYSSETEEESIKTDEDDISKLIPEESKDLGDFKFLKSSSFVKKENKSDNIDSDNNEYKESKPIVIGEVFNTYIIVQKDNDMYLFDKHAAHERYIFEKIKNDADNLDSQLLFEPVNVLLSFEEYDAVISNLDYAKQFGFILEDASGSNIRVLGVPTIIQDTDPSDILSELAHNFLEHRHNPNLSLFDELYHSIACKAAIKGNIKSEKIELQSLIDNIFNDDNIKYCPHGRPVFVKLSKKDIEKQFKRIV